MKTFLYFFQAPGRIKIGVSKNVRQRLQDVGAHMEHPPKLIDAIPGGFELEKFVHLRLRHHRIKGEWFKDCAEVRETVDALLRDGPEALGYIGGRGRAKKFDFVPAERSSEDWLRMFNELAALMFPADPADGIAEELELPVDDCREYLAGSREVPRVVKAAFASILVTWMLTERAKERRSEET